MSISLFFSSITFFIREEEDEEDEEDVDEEMIKCSTERDIEREERALWGPERKPKS